MSISHWCSLRGPTAHHCQQHNRDVDDWTAHTRLRVKMAPVKSSQVNHSPSDQPVFVQLWKHKTVTEGEEGSSVFR